MAKTPEGIAAFTASSMKVAEELALDGLDIDSSRRVRVTDCNISTADDAITLRAAGQGHLKNDGPCADITVSNCTFSSDCNAIRLGVGNGRIRDCSFTGIRIENTRYAVNAVGAWGAVPQRGHQLTKRFPRYIRPRS